MNFTIYDCTIWLLICTWVPARLLLRTLEYRTDCIILLIIIIIKR